MKEITIYSLVHCPYCVRAKDLLCRNKIPYQEIIADELPKTEVDGLFSRSGMRTFPQIFASNELIGGYAELKKIDESIGLQSYLK